MIGKSFEKAKAMPFSDTHTFNQLDKGIRHDWFKVGEDEYMVFSYPTNQKPEMAGSAVHLHISKARAFMQELKDLAEKGDSLRYAMKFSQTIQADPQRRLYGIGDSETSYTVKEHKP